MTDLISGSHLWRTSCVGCGTTTISIPEKIATARCGDCLRDHTGATGTQLPADRCLECGTTEGVRLYLRGAFRHPHRPAPRPDHYGILIPIGHTRYAGPRETPTRSVEDKPPLGPPTITVLCLGHGEIAAVHTDEQARQVLSGHHRANHDRRAWIVGGRGGASRPTCERCATPLSDGSLDHGHCDGPRRCGCKHNHTPVELP